MFTSKPKVNDKVLYKICSVNLRRTGEMCARAVHLVISTYIKALCPIIFAYCKQLGNLSEHAPDKPGERVEIA